MGGGRGRGDAAAATVDAPAGGGCGHPLAQLSAATGDELTKVGPALFPPPTGASPRPPVPPPPPRAPVRTAVVSFRRVEDVPRISGILCRLGVGENARFRMVVVPSWGRSFFGGFVMWIESDGKKAIRERKIN